MESLVLEGAGVATVNGIAAQGQALTIRNVSVSNVTAAAVDGDGEGGASPAELASRRVALGVVCELLLDETLSRACLHSRQPTLEMST